MYPPIAPREESRRVVKAKLAHSFQVSEPSRRRGTQLTNKILCSNQADRPHTGSYSSLYHAHSQGLFSTGFRPRSGSSVPRLSRSPTDIQMEMAALCNNVVKIIRLSQTSDSRCSGPAEFVPTNEIARSENESSASAVNECQ